MVKSPSLRSLILDNNEISDDGLARLALSLKDNNKLAHLSIKGCDLITDNGLQMLCDVISKENTVLFQINFDIERYDPDLAAELQREAALNRAIQEHLKPSIHMQKTPPPTSPLSVSSHKSLKLSSHMSPRSQNLTKEV